MSPTMNTKYALAGCFPRVSGDEPGPDVIGPPLRAFSPRERG